MKVFISILVFLSVLQTSVIASEIPSMYQLVSGENKVPPKLFYAMILNESRSRTKNPKYSNMLPWPWTINHRGKSHFFPTKDKAYRYAKSLVAKGDKLFDVGLGQVNWHWHEKRFQNLWAAFDPYTNLTVAAQYLREQYEREECHSWELAVGCYHRRGQRNKDKQIASQYRNKVISIWKKI